MVKYTTYRIATHWCHNSYILCNNIIEKDFSVLENARFDMEDAGEIFQWYITDASQSDVEYLEKHFNLLFTYSDMLDCFILCVNHYGTSWDYVACDVSDELADIWGDDILYHDTCNPPRIEETRRFVAGGVGE